MLKNISWDTKDKLKISLIMFLVVLSKVFFESIENGFTSANDIALEVIASLAVAAFIMTSITDNGFKLFSTQGIFAAATAVVTFGFVISYMLISREALYSVLFASVMVILAQHFHLLPVATLLGVSVLFFENRPEVYSLAMNGIPAAIGVSCVCLSEKIKNSAVWKKIIFAAAQLVMIVSAVKVFIVFRFNITVHSFVVQMWDSIASFVAIIILLILAVYAIKTKKSIGEIFGYIAVAAFGVVPTFMEMKYVFVSAMTMFMMLTACAKDGMAADELFGTAAKSVISKVKNKIK